MLKHTVQNLFSDLASWNLLGLLHLGQSIPLNRCHLTELAVVWQWAHDSTSHDLIHGQDNRCTCGFLSPIVQLVQ
jgi:hypothetical protein